MKQTVLFFAIICTALGLRAQLVNTEFETWDSTPSGSVYPHQWPLLANQYCVRDSHAYQGSYALQVSVWYYYSKTTAVQKAAINFRPMTFSGYYKYTDNSIKSLVTQDMITDTAIASIYLTKWNLATQQNDTIGIGRVPLFATANYSQFVCPVQYSNADIPDSVTILLDPSLARRYIDASLYNANSNTDFALT
jgi:hypothetical protein